MNSLVIRKTNVRATVAIFLISAVFGYIAGFRPFGIGFDFLNYQSFYNSIGPDDELSYFRYEPGFVFLTSWFKSLTDLDYTYFASFLMAMSLMIKFIVLKRLDHPVLAVIFYLCVWFPMHENTQIRLAVATAFLFLATEKMFERRWEWFVVLSAIASTFHVTAAVAAASLATASFLARYRLRFSIPLTGLGGVALSASFTTVMHYAVQWQPLLLEQGGGNTSPNLFSGFNIATALFLLFYAASGSVKDYRGRTFFLVTCGGFLVLLALFPVPVMAQRLKELLMIFMTFIAFEYRITIKTMPQALLASALAGWALYSAISYGLFSD